LRRAVVDLRRAERKTGRRHVMQHPMASMRRSLVLAAGLFLSVLLCGAQAQFGNLSGLSTGATPDPKFDATFAKLLGEHQAFSADMEYAILDADNKPTSVVPGKLSFLEGKSRFVLDLSQVKGLGMVADMAAQLKTMGMAELVMIRRPDKSLKYLVYPGLASYTEEKLVTDAKEIKDKTKAAPRKEVTALGRETIESHPCMKNKVVVIDDQEQRSEATLWNATDLKEFPVRMEMVEDGKTTARTFKNIKLAKPETALFEPPADMTRYESPAAMLQGAVMKAMGLGK
jgi:hypothetical protein